MNAEGQELDLKSIRYALGKQADIDGLACDCVGFANASGGAVLLGIEDRQAEPPTGQRIDDPMIDALRRRIPQITVNVYALPPKPTPKTGAQYIQIRPPPNHQTIASPSN